MRECHVGRWCDCFCCVLLVVYVTHGFHCSVYHLLQLWSVISPSRCIFDQLRLFCGKTVAAVIMKLLQQLQLWNFHNSYNCHHETFTTVAAVIMKLLQQLQLSSWNYCNSCSCHHETFTTVAAVVMKLLQQLQLSSWNFSRIDFSSNCAKIQTTGTNNASSHYWVATSGECQSSAADRKVG